jgi:dihydrofolate synthase/folylpolyglutamate synthase
VITQSTSDRAVSARELGRLATSIFGEARVTIEPSLEAALEIARSRAGNTEKGAALVTGSITLVGDSIVYARNQGWKQ